MSTSIVEYFSGNEASRCGYCKGNSSSYTHGMWAHLMSIEDYQDLIDRMNHGLSEATIIDLYNEAKAQVGKSY